MAESSRPLRPQSVIARILSGSVLGQGILIAISPLLTRLYSPSDFGALAVVTSVSAVLGTIVTLCWEAAIVLPKEEISGKALSYLGIASTIVVSIPITIAAFLWRVEIARALGSSVLADYWWIAPLTIFVIGIYKVCSTWYVRTGAYGKIAWRNLTQGVAQAGFNVVIGLAGAGSIGLVAGVAVGRGVALLGMFGSRSAVSHPRPSLGQIRANSRAYRRFPLITSWSYTLNAVGLQLPIVLLSVLYNSYEVGFLALTIRVLASPVGIVADAVSQYFEGAFGSRLRARNGGLSALIRSITGRLTLIAIVPIAAVVVFAPWAFSTFFGARWIVAGTYAQILALAYLMQFVAAPISRAITLMEKQGTQLAWDVGRAVGTCGAIIIAGITGLPMIWGIILFGCAQFTAYVVLLALSISLARKRDAIDLPV